MERKKVFIDDQPYELEFAFAGREAELGRLVDIDVFTDAKEMDSDPAYWTKKVFVLDQTKIKQALTLAAGKDFADRFSETLKRLEVAKVLASFFSQVAESRLKLPHEIGHSAPSSPETVPA